MRIMLSETEIDDLILNGSLRVTKNIVWRLKEGKRHFCFRIPVENSFQGKSYDLKLVGTKNVHVNNYSYILLLDNLRIRAFDPKGTHINRYPKRESIKGPHKHKWRDQNMTSFAYVPNDITDPSNLRQTFLEFCKECEIIFTGTFALPPETQPELPLLE